MDIGHSHFILWRLLYKASKCCMTKSAQLSFICLWHGIIVHIKICYAWHPINSCRCFHQTIFRVDMRLSPPRLTSTWCKLFTHGIRQKFGLPVFLRFWSLEIFITRHARIPNEYRLVVCPCLYHHENPMVSGISLCSVRKDSHDKCGNGYTSLSTEYMNLWSVLFLLVADCKFTGKYKRWTLVSLRYGKALYASDQSSDKLIIVHALGCNNGMLRFAFRDIPSAMTSVVLSPLQCFIASVYCVMISSVILPPDLQFSFLRSSEECWNIRGRLFWAV